MFRYSICDPLKKEPIEMGDIEKEKIVDILDKFPWTELLNKMKDVKESEIHFSPSIEFENKGNRHGVTISLIGDETEHEFYIFYKRPKMIKKLFGLMKTMDENHLTDRTGQTKKHVKEAVTALINDDFATLEKRWG